MVLTKVCGRCKAGLNNDNWNPCHQRRNAHICKKCACLEAKRFYKKHIIEKRKIYHIYYLNNYRKINARSRRTQYRNKITVIKHYSPDMSCQNPKCLVPSGCRDMRCLSMDHINGGGTRHVDEIKKHGTSTLYAWLIKNNYPKGYQVLCMNCQFIKRIENKEFPNRKKR